MKEMTRRGLLAATPLAGVALAAALPGKTLGREKPAPARAECFWIGPYPLADWYKSRPDKRSPFNIGTGPSYDDIVESLKECRVYLLEQRIVDVAGELLFGKDEDGFPRVTLEGKLYHSWTVDGKDFAICVEKVTSRGVCTDYHRLPAVRIVSDIAIDIRFEGENGFARGSCSQSHILRKPVAYDINGKLLPGK